MAPHLAGVDLLLVMTVQPGFGGQEFDPRGLEKIAALADLRRRDGLAFEISVDGGINDETAAPLPRRRRRHPGVGVVPVQGGGPGGGGAELAPACALAAPAS